MILSDIITRDSRLTPSIADKAPLLTFPTRNRYRAGDYSGQTTSCCGSYLKHPSVNPAQVETLDMDLL